MIILGIDPAMRCTGYSVIEIKNADDISILDCGVIRNKAKMPHSECLRRLAGGIRELVIAFDPDVCSIEDVFYGKNVKTAMILSLARGAIITVLAENDIPVYPFSPRSAKKAAVGSGAASKEQVAFLMSSMLGIDVNGVPLDSTDALALAVCLGQFINRPDLKMMLPKTI
jgi:crossover junction endodeoxyribonuclease RuvC